MATVHGETPKEEIVLLKEGDEFSAVRLREKIVPVDRITYKDVVLDRVVYKDVEQIRYVTKEVIKEIPKYVLVEEIVKVKRGVFEDEIIPRAVFKDKEIINPIIKNKEVVNAIIVDKEVTNAVIKDVKVDKPNYVPYDVPVPKFEEHTIKITTPVMREEVITVEKIRTREGEKLKAGDVVEVV